PRYREKRRGKPPGSEFAVPLYLSGLPLSKSKQLANEEDVRRVHRDRGCFPLAFDVGQLLNEVASIVRMPFIKQKGAILLLRPLQVVQKSLTRLPNQQTMTLAPLVSDRTPGIVSGDLYV